MIDQLVSALQDGLRIQQLDPTKPIALPDGINAKSLESFLPAPTRPRGELAFQSLNSLLEYAERHHFVGHTAIFADNTDNVVRAFLNWHSPSTLPSEGYAGWGDHSASYTLKFTREYSDWTGINGKPLTQTQFAEFLEEHLPDIHEPEPAALLEAASRLSGKRNITFESSKRLDNGDVSIEWKEDTQTSNGTFPSKFVIRIPIYRGAEKATTFEIKALLRYRINEGGKLSFEVKLLHVDLIRDMAFEQILTSIRETVATWGEDAKTPIYTGSIAKKP